MVIVMLYPCCPCDTEARQYKWHLPFLSSIGLVNYRMEAWWALTRDIVPESKQSKGFWQDFQPINWKFVILVKNKHSLRIKLWCGSVSSTVVTRGRVSVRSRLWSDDFWRGNRSRWCFQPAQIPQQPLCSSKGQTKPCRTCVTETHRKQRRFWASQMISELLLRGNFPHLEAG